MPKKKKKNQKYQKQNNANENNANALIEKLSFKFSEKFLGINGYYLLQTLLTFPEIFLISEFNLYIQNYQFSGEKEIFDKTPYYYIKECVIFLSKNPQKILNLFSSKGLLPKEEILEDVNSKIESKNPDSKNPNKDKKMGIQECLKLLSKQGILTQEKILKMKNNSDESTIKMIENIGLMFFNGPLKPSLKEIRISSTKSAINKSHENMVFLIKSAFEGTLKEKNTKEFLDKIFSIKSLGNEQIIEYLSDLSNQKGLDSNLEKYVAFNLSEMPSWALTTLFFSDSAEALKTGLSLIKKEQNKELLNKFHILSLIFEKEVDLELKFPDILQSIIDSGEKLLKPFQGNYLDGSFKNEFFIYFIVLGAKNNLSLKSIQSERSFKIEDAIKFRLLFLISKYYLLNHDIKCIGLGHQPTSKELYEASMEYYNLNPGAKPSDPGLKNFLAEQTASILYQLITNSFVFLSDNNIYNEFNLYFYKIAEVITGIKSSDLSKIFNSYFDKEILNPSENLTEEEPKRQINLNDDPTRILQNFLLTGPTEIKQFFQKKPIGKHPVFKSIIFTDVFLLKKLYAENKLFFQTYP